MFVNCVMSPFVAAAAGAEPADAASEAPAFPAAGSGRRPGGAAAGPDSPAHCRRHCQQPEPPGTEGFLLQQGNGMISCILPCFHLGCPIHEMQLYLYNRMNQLLFCLFACLSITHNILHIADCIFIKLGQIMHLTAALQPFVCIIVCI